MYAIDRIENGIVIAENLETKKKVELKIESFPFEPQEKTIFKIEDGIILEEENIENQRKQSLREKMERLKKHE